MLERSDYVIPYFNNHYRFDKPPFIYWCQTLSYRVFGENDFAARFPSAVAAALTAMILFAWGRRIRNERLAWWAALIFTLCLQTFMHAKAAVADMWLVCFMTAAYWAGYELLRDRLRGEDPTAASFVAPERRWWWIFYCSLVLAFLTKGPVGWLPLVTIAATKFFLPDLKLNRRFLFLTGILFTLSLVALWGIPALLRSNGEFFAVGIGKHVVSRSFIAMEGHGGGSLWAYLGMLPFYFVAIFFTFAPWSLKLPWLAQKLWRGRDPLDNYLLAGIIVVFLVFTLVKTKLPHYILPAFPLLALLLAKALVDLPGAQRFFRRATVSAIAVAFFIVVVSPIAGRYCPSRQLMRQAQADLTHEMEFGATEYREPSLVWYFRRYVDGWMTELNDEGVRPFMAKPGARFAIMRTESARKKFPALPPGWKSYRARGINSAKGAWVDLTLILKPS